MRTMRCRVMIVVTVVTGVLGLGGCDQQPSRGDRARKSSDRSEAPASSPAHPDVPGRTEPCPRPGGVEKSGYPCEPTPPRKATSESSGEQKAREQKGEQQKGRQE
jgi:hypothetical protein